MKRLNQRTAFLLAMLLLAFSCQKDKMEPNEMEGTVTDPDGWEYRWKKMADGKAWLLENLRYDVPGYGVYLYENDEANLWYGRLYSRDTAKAACAALGDGWRVPTDWEWLALINAYGGMETAYDSLREGGSSGFDARLGGLQDYLDGWLWRGLGNDGYYLSSTGFFQYEAWYYRIHDRDERWDRGFGGGAMSCRCIKGEKDERPEMEVDTVVLADGKTWTARNLDIVGLGYENRSWWYEDDEEAYGEYGRLYSWGAAIAACTELGGTWRLPSDEDWMALADAYGGLDAAYGALIEGGGSGFDARFGGLRSRQGYFGLLGDFGMYWSSTDGPPRHEEDYNAYIYRFDAVQDTLGRGYHSDNKSGWGYSCRCVKE